MYEGDPAAFEAQVQRQAGTVRFESEDAADGMGGLGLLILSAYPLALGSLWLWIVVCAIGLAVVVRCLTEARHRVATGPAWLLICLLTGFGFFAYLWSEPAPLLHRRPAGPGGPLRALLATAAAGLLLVVGGWLLRSAVSWARGLSAMSVYVSVRGWLECDREQLNAVKAIVESHSGHRYSGGWGFPVRPFNWTSYAFYGGDLQEQDVPWLFGQLAAIAELPASDEDGDRVQGLFMATHEMTGLTEWQIRGGAVHVLPGDDRHQYLDPL